MRVLLLHPEDDFRGPWKDQRWDWVVDLGRAPKSFYDEWSATLGCPVSSIYDFAVEVADLQDWRSLFAVGMGGVVDRFGLDWWDVFSLMLQPEMQDVRLALRLAARLTGCRALTTSRPSLLANAVHLRSGIPLQVLQSGVRPRLAHRVARYRTALMNLSFQQLRQVVYDKYDPHYLWRRKFARSIPRSSQPIVLLPSAYSNVTRTALKYASVLPDQQFLLVLARESAAMSSLPANVQSVALAAFATEPGDQAELRGLENRWIQLERTLAEHPEFSVQVQLGLVHKGMRFLRWGLSIRNAWNRVFESYSVVGCLSADDANPYTRVPLMLAEHRGSPAVACHHGALNCSMAFKVPQCSTYLAQGEMERDYVERICGLDPRNVRIGAPTSPADECALRRNDAPWVVFFAEPYEADHWRVEAIYREVLPRLCAAARRSGKTVILKLHPFETAGQRRRLVKATLDKNDQRVVRIVASPMSREILRNTWCAVTVESTAAFECASVGIPAFLCGWLRHAYSGYALQYARFGVGRILETPADLLRIPEMIAETMPAPGVASRLVQSISQDLLTEVLLQPAAHNAFSGHRIEPAQT